MHENRVQLRVLVLDGSRGLFDEITRAVAALEHEVIPRRATLDAIGEVTRAESPDVAIVIVGLETRQSLDLIGKIVHEAACPVIAVLDVQDRAFINEAAKRGVFAYLTGGGDIQELQSSIDIVLRRFAEYHNLEGAFGRRAVTERAKGILMERHQVDEAGAFAMLREESRRTNRKIVDVAEGVVATFRLLPGASQETSSGARATDD